MSTTGADGGPSPGRSRPGDDAPAPEWTAIDAPSGQPGPAAPLAKPGPGPGPGDGAHDRPAGPLLIGPMNFADILDGAFTLYRANARTLVTVTAVFILPLQLVVAWLGRDLFSGSASEVFADPSSNGFTFSSSTNGAAAAVSILGSMLVVPFLRGAASRVASASYFGGRLGPAAALRAVRGRWWAFLAAAVLVNMAEAAGGVLFFFPALLVMALFVATAPAIAIEGLGPIQGMRRSARLLRSRMFPVMGIALGSAVVVAAVNFALGWLPALLGVVSGPWGWLFRAAGAVTTSVLITPYVAVVATLVYFDARIRSEGMDVAILAGRLEHRRHDA